MAAPLTISIVQSRRYEYGDTAELEVDSVLQPDSWPIWGFERNLLGFGHGPYGGGGYGAGDSLGYGNGGYGLGLWGQGARIVSFLTIGQFVAGDFTLRVRARDGIGNVDGWSDAVIHQHRPVPPTPTDLAILGGILGWTWSDP